MMDYAKLLYLYLGYIWDSNTSNGVLDIGRTKSVPMAETVPMAATIRPLLRGLHHIYFNLMITYIVFSQMSVLEIYEWYTFMVTTIIHY